MEIIWSQQWLCPEIRGWGLVFVRGGEWISRSSFRRSHIARLGVAVVLTQLGLTQILLSPPEGNAALAQTLLRSYSVHIHRGETPPPLG